MTIDRDQAEALLSAIDAAFHEGLHGRYGGGVVAVVQDGDGDPSESVLRPVPPGLENMLVLGMSLRDNPAPAGTGLLGSVPTVPLGRVELRPAPEPGAGEVHVETELFDEHDPNGTADAGCLSTGLLVGRASAPGLPTAGVHLAVVRSAAAIEAAGLDAAQDRRGWLPQQDRGRVNRSGGLGSNGFRRAAVPALPQPAAQALLGRLGDRVAQAEGIGPTLDRLVVGFRIGAAGTR